MSDFQRARRTMVDNQLRTSGITDRRLLAAMGQVPRELFVPETRRTLAYIDEAHPLPGPSGRAMAAPAPFAKLVQLAGIDEDDAVLDIGTGHGYSAAVLARLADRVVAVESDPELVRVARETLGSLGGGNITLVEAPLDAGAPEHGPYDAIVIEGAVVSVPQALFDQLGDGGRLVALIRTGAAPVATLYVRSGERVAARPEFNTSLPPLTSERPVEKFVF